MEIKQLLEISVKEKASDLLISPGSPPVLRINGDLTPYTAIPVLDADMTKALIYSVMNEDQRNEFDSILEIDFSISLQELGSFRINAYHQSRGCAAAFRVIPETTPTLDMIGAPPIFKEILNLSSGLILVTGPTGSGKSTTLAAMIDYVNTHQARHVVTIEDPIEFIHQNKKCLIDQRQVHRDTLDFSGALRSALRENPNVILVGEMRDLETIRLALTAAETGHLVMSTLHTSSAARAVNRIVDVFPTGEKNIIRFLLSDSLQAVIYQSLLKKKTGGMVAAFEVMTGTTAIRNLIRENKIAHMNSVLQTSSQFGMTTLDQYIAGLVEKGIIEAPKK